MHSFSMADFSTTKYWYMSLISESSYSEWIFRKNHKNRLTASAFAMKTSKQKVRGRQFQIDVENVYIWPFRCQGYGLAKSRGTETAPIRREQNILQRKRSCGMSVGDDLSFRVCLRFVHKHWSDNAFNIIPPVVTSCLAR